MGHIIAVAGKGGVGKTTLTGLLIQYLCESGKKPVLAVDADANANLNEVLGVGIECTLGELREEIERAGVDSRYQIPVGMTKQAYLEARLSDAITEEDDYDLMVMGRTQGQGCYCFVNGLVQTQIQKLQSNYPYVVVDNEAGMEHISRGLIPTMEIAILVSDCSRRGVQAAGRIAALMKELNTTGKYEITSEMKEKLADFYGNYASEKETADTIRDLYEKTGYVIDTHTAVAASVYHKYKKDTNDAETKTVIASTASPFKFSRSVMDAIDPKYDSLSEFELVDELSKIGNVKIPQAIEEIRSAEVRHKTVCEVEEMPKVVKQFLGM